MMTSTCIPSEALALDGWIRGAFKQHNTALEILYNKLPDPALIVGTGESIKAALRQEGSALVSALEMVQRWPTDPDVLYDMLGNVGLYLGALRRHGVAGMPGQARAAQEEPAYRLAQRLATTLGVSPRFANAHLNLRNEAHNGIYKSFTSLAAELTFIEYNSLSIFAFIQTSDILRRIEGLGVSHPVTGALLDRADQSLRDVLASNATLAEMLDVRAFFYNVRPYFKTYQVGSRLYRGANAGDFSGINEVDLMLGVCEARDPFYAAILLEKRPFLMPEDQARLDVCCRRPGLLDLFLEALAVGEDSPALLCNARAFLKLCATFGQTARQHHELFIERFIRQPASTISEPEDLTASGPPLEVLLDMLRGIVERRAASAGTGIPTRHADLERIRHSVGEHARRHEHRTTNA